MLCAVFLLKRREFIRGELCLIVSYHMYGYAVFGKQLPRFLDSSFSSAEPYFHDCNSLGKIIYHVQQHLINLKLTSKVNIDTLSVVRNLLLCLYSQLTLVALSVFGTGGAAAIVQVLHIAA